MFPERRRVGGVLLAVGILLAVIWVGGLLFRANRALSYITALDSQAAQVQQFVAENGQAALSSPEGTGSLYQALQVMNSEIDVIERDIGPLLGISRYLGWVPGYGRYIRAAPDILTVVEGAVATGEILTNLMYQAARRSAAGEGQTLALAQTLQENPEQLDQARSAWDRAMSARSRVDTSVLPDRLTVPLELFDRAAPILDSGLRLGKYVPDLIGMNGPKVYLVLAQSEDELRPTGGFITAAGYLRIEDGFVADLDVRDSYAFDDFSKYYPDPPEPIFEYMGAEQWLLRDANWSPDFPEAAEIAAGLAQIGSEVEVDGVIAIDQTAIQYILDSVGPVEVITEDGPEWVGALNFFEWMHQSWAPAAGEAQDRNWWLTRKTFVGDLARSLREKLESDGSIDAVALLSAITRALQEKHILLYVREPGVAAVLSDLNWDGHVHLGSSDYLMVVETNVGFNKASPVIERKIDHRVELKPDGSVGAVTVLSYAHRSTKALDSCDPSPRYDAVYAEMMNRCYWNYVRLVVPESAELQSAPQIVVSGENLLRGRPSRDTVDVEQIGESRKSWGELVLIKPGQHEVLEYVYHLPAGTVQQVNGHLSYELRLQKQPGLKSLPVTLHVLLPEGASLLRSDPDPMEVGGNVLKFQIDLVEDQSVSIDFSR